nr:MAG TPA: hypothetical protein [Caudoviricetes sp.]
MDKTYIYNRKSTRSNYFYYSLCLWYYQVYFLREMGVLTLTIKEARENAKLTQAKMSELLEIPKRTIEDWENGRRKPPIYVEKLVVNELVRIAKENK